MSEDYLGLLISRSFAALDVVRPRPVSRFERRSPDVAVTREDEVPSLAAPEIGMRGREAGALRAPPGMIGAPPAPVGVDASPDPRPAAHLRSVTAVAAPHEMSAVFSRDNEALPVQPPWTTAEPPARAVMTATPPPLSPRASDAGVRQPPTPQPERIEAAPDATPPRRQAVIQPIRREVIVERPAEPPPSVEPRPRVPSPASRAGTRAVMPAPALPHPAPDSPPRPIEWAAVIEPRVAGQADQRSGSPPEPAIHVTIGRIEIRATTPAAAPVRRQPRQPSVMSLDEYLKQRAGGGPR